MEEPMVNFQTPNHQHEALCKAFLKECETHQSELHGTSDLDAYPFEEWLEKVKRYRKGDNLPSDRVKAETFLVFDKDELVGMVNIRLELNDYLRNIGGHIGYMVRPTKRRQGYAKALLKETLVFCKEHIKDTHVIISCDEKNIASKKTILYHGGELIRNITEDGENVHVFKIKL